MHPPWSNDQPFAMSARHRSLSQSMAYAHDAPMLYRSNPNLLTRLTLLPSETSLRSALAPTQSKQGSRSDDHMNLSDDEDSMLSSLLSHEIGEFVLKIDSAEAALRA